jgi:NAD(P)-dependent dehydrogenase (short-subunit alcohol dehydrogenase family)
MEPMNAAQFALSESPGSAEPLALVTGASSGIGLFTAKGLAQNGYRVVLACRSEQKAQFAMERILQDLPQAQLEFLPLDLSSFKSIHQCAQAFLARHDRLDLLINNAGLGGERGLTRDGFELAFGVNHLGHYLLTQRLLSALLKSEQKRVVHVASRAHRFAHSIPWAQLQRPSQSFASAREYAVSKLANILFSRELSRRHSGDGLCSYAVHPGVIRSEFWRQLPGALKFLVDHSPLLTPEQGAQTTLHCALKASKGETGLYFANSRVQTPSQVAQDDNLAEQLWAHSQAWVGV